MSEKKEPLRVIAGAPDSPLVISGVEIPCYVLGDETRVLVQRGVGSGLGMSSTSGHRLTKFIQSKNLKPFISEELGMVIDKPIQFEVAGRVAYGYPATLLVDLCNVVLEARRFGQLQKQQEHIGERCEILIRGLASVGIIALVDEATGYEKIKTQRALATILEKFIATELQPWTKTFPYDFYELLYKLRGWSGPEGHKRTHQIAHNTNDLVYERLAPGVLKELRRKNPIVAPGRRKNRHHQWFTPDLGHPKLKLHLAGVMALMRAAPNWDSFKRSLQRAFPKKNITIPMALDDNI